MFVFFAWVDFVVWRSLRCVALRVVVLRVVFVIFSLVLLLRVCVSGLFFCWFVALCFGLRFECGGFWFVCFCCSFAFVRCACLV